LHRLANGGTPTKRGLDPILPYFIDSGKIDNLTENILQKRLFALPEDTDLLGLKDMIRDSY
jgi:hypothetical protein